MAKKNGTVIKWVGAIGTLIFISLMAVIGWVQSSSKFQTSISTRVEINEKNDDLWHTQIANHNIAVAEIRKDILRIEERTNQTQSMQEQILENQTLILNEIRKK